MVRRLLFLCGLLAVVVYIVAVVLGGALRPGYNHLSMAVSELIESGAPNKPLLDALFIVYNALLIVFAWAVGMSQRGRALTTVGAVLLAVVGVLGLLLTLFFPSDPRGAAQTTTGTIHLVVAGVLSLGTILSILFLALGSAERDPFWIYSMVSCALVLITGALAAYAAAVSYPLLGLAERVTIGLFLQWIAAVSIKLIKEDLGR